MKPSLSRPDQSSKIGIGNTVRFSGAQKPFAPSSIRSHSSSASDSASSLSGPGTSSSSSSRTSFLVYSSESLIFSTRASSSAISSACGSVCSPWKKVSSSNMTSLVEMTIPLCRIQILYMFVELYSTRYPMCALGFSFMSS